MVLFLPGPQRLTESLYLLCGGANPDLLFMYVDVGRKVISRTENEQDLHPLLH